MRRMINFLRLMQLLSRTARLFFPWMWRTFLFMLGFIGTTIMSFWGSVPQTVSAIADDWLDRAVRAGFPTIWDRQLYYVLWTLAFLMIVLGWVILSYATIWLVGRIF